MVVILRIIRGEPLGARLLFPPGEYLFGRSPECHVRFPNHLSVSRRHFLLRVTEQGTSVRDLRSRHKTLVNRECLWNAERNLSKGDHLWLPTTTFLVEIGPENDPGLPAARRVSGQPLNETNCSPDGYTELQISFAGGE
jgi:pSer/pThr/pTyr-binding forkhead associated (FHA) protein